MVDEHLEKRKNAGDEPQKKRAGKSILPIVATIAVIAVVAFLAYGFFGFGEPTGLVAIPFTQPEATTDEATNQAEVDSTNIAPSEFAVRQRYFEEAFKPTRDKYDLFEKASDYLSIPIEQVPNYFNLSNEEEVFADLPNIAEDFSEISYMLAQGRYYSIDYLDETYFKHPEFYPNFKDYGLPYWTKPDPKYWTPHGYGSYPSEQWDTLKKSERTQFRAIAFFYTNWGVQTWQGTTLMQDSESQKYFDIDISPQNFLLEPTFPKFHENWAQKIVINGTVKPDTPPGNYVIAINVEIPPRELISKWEFEHKNIYYNAATTGIGPSGNQIQFNISVEE